MNALMLAIVLASLPTSLATAITIPIPSNRYGVDSCAIELIDRARLDPYAPTPQPRRLMLSVFAPSGPKEDCDPYPAAYMPPATAAVHDTIFGPFGVASGTFESLALSLCHATTLAAPSHRPAILFSPGLGNSHLLYSALAQTVASHGTTVLTVDHPYDASIVAYPDGATVLAANISTDAQIIRAVAVRAADLAFVAHSLRHHPRLCGPLPIDVDPKHLLVAGHSLGGATALSALVEHPALLAGGVNLDGAIYGSGLSQPTRRPFLLFGHDGKNQSTDPSWAAAWPHLLGSKLELALLGASHGTFTDLPVLADALGLRAKMPSAIDAALGSISGARALDVLAAYLHAFCEFALGRAEAGILTRPLPAYPDVEVVEADL